MKKKVFSNKIYMTLFKYGKGIIFKTSIFKLLKHQFTQLQNASVSYKSPPLPPDLLCFEGSKRFSLFELFLK